MKRTHRIVYCTDKDITKGKIYMFETKDKDEYDKALEYIKKKKYTIIQRTR